VQRGYLRAADREALQATLIDQHSGGLVPLGLVKVEPQHG